METQKKRKKVITRGKQATSTLGLSNIIDRNWY